MRLCILKPNRNVYSETFIARQITLLKPVKVLHEGWYPTVEDGISFLPFPFRHLFFRGLFRNLLPRLYHRYYTRKLSNYFIQNRIDAVVANYGPMGVTVADACAAARIPLIVHFHGFDAYHRATVRKYREGYRRLFDQAAALIAVSGDMTSALLNLGADEKKIWFNPYAVDAALFGPTDPAAAGPVFLFAGRFTPKKAPSLLIRSFAKVLEEVPEARLVMMGDGGLLPTARSLAAELNIADRVEFTGAKTHGEVAEAMAHARAFVQHSLTAEDGDKEGTPNTVLEASCRALPVVSTAHAGIREAVIHGKTGYLVEEGDWQQMAEYMIALARDPRLAQQLGAAGRHHVTEHYSTARQQKTFEQIFESISHDL